MRMPFESPATDPPRVGKALAVGRLRIPVHLDDPVQVLANLHTATGRLNATQGCSNESNSATIDLGRMASLIPPTVAHVGMQLYTGSGLRHRLAPICHGSVSYIAVEPVPAYCAGAKVVGMHTVAPLAEGSGLNIALTSRGEQLDVSVLCVSRQCACGRRYRDRDRTLCRYSVGGRTGISSRARPFRRHRDDGTPRESFTRPALLTGQFLIERNGRKRGCPPTSPTSDLRWKGIAARPSSPIDVASPSTSGEEAQRLVHTDSLLAQYA